MAELKFVPTACIVEIPDAIRTHKADSKDIRDLAEDIFVRGITDTPKASDNGDGTYNLVNGARRLTAFKLLVSEGRMKDLFPIVVVESMTNLQIVADQIAANYHVKKTINSDFIRGIYRICMQGNFPLEEVAKKVGFSIEYLRRLFTTIALPEEATKLMDESKLSIVNAIDLSKIIKILPEDQVDLWIDNACTMTNTELVVAIAAEQAAIRDANKAARVGKLNEFTPTSNFVGKDELYAIYVQTDSQYAEQPSEKLNIELQLLKRLLQLDEASVAAARGVWEKKQADMAEAARLRKIAREQKKLAELVGETVTN
jgi:ParB-like chromosome segregation protein Spo0J